MMTVHMFTFESFANTVCRQKALVTTHRWENVECTTCLAIGEMRDKLKLATEATSPDKQARLLQQASDAAVRAGIVAVGA